MVPTSHAADPGRPRSSPPSHRPRELLADLKAQPFEPEPEWDEPDDVPDFSLPNVPLSQMGPMRDIIAMLSHLPESQIREMRKAPPKGVPAEMFEAVLAIARGGKMPPPPPPPPPAPRAPLPPRPSPAKPPPPADSNQLNLF